MKNLFKALEVNGGDNIVTAFGKGMIEGSVKTALVTTALGAGVFVLGKTLLKCETLDEVIEQANEAGFYEGVETASEEV